jgi:chromosome segregation ATPase
MKDDSDLLQERIAALESKLNSVKTRSSDLMEITPRLSRARTPSHSSVHSDVLEEEPVDPKLQVSMLKAQLQQQDRAHSVTQAKWMTELESVKRQFELELQGKDTVISRLEAKAADLGQELHRVQSRHTQVNELKTSIENLQTERAHALRRTKAAEGETKQLTKLIHEFHEELESIKGAAALVDRSLRQKVNEAEARAHTAQLKAADLEAQLEISESRHFSDKSRVESIVTAQSRLEQEVQLAVQDNLDLKSQLEGERQQRLSQQRAYARELAEAKAASPQVPLSLEMNEVKRQLKQTQEELELLKSNRPETPKVIEHKLMKLQMEKQELEGELQHLPIHARTQQARRRKVEVEEDMGILEANISTLKQKLRSMRATAS